MHFVIASDTDQTIIGSADVIHCKTLGTFRKLAIPPAEETADVKHVSITEKKRVTSLCFSKDFSKFAAALLKQFLVFDASGNLLKNKMSRKNISRLKFLHGNDLLIADKAGDIYLYSYENDEMKYLLGHLSIVLDCLVTDCGKFLISCDRDEKIRVSNYPNCYSIQAYCLGHTEYVVRVLQVSGDKIISASGDGTLRLWDYKNGKELAVHLCFQTIEDPAFKKMREALADIEMKAAPIISLEAMNVGNSKWILAMSFPCFLGIVLYDLDSNLNAITNMRRVLYEADVLCYTFIEKSVLIVTYNELIEYSLSNDSASHNCLDFLLEIDLNYYVEYVKGLFKKRYDNVSEYQERKRKRLETGSSLS